MTNKEELQKKFKNKFVQDDYIIGSKETQEPVTLEEIFDFFWQEIEQARRARDEELVDKVKKANKYQCSDLYSQPDDDELLLMNEVLQIIKHQDE